MNNITTEDVNRFLNGRDPMERIITIETDYKSDKVSIVYVNEEGKKKIRLDDFKPFIWVKNSAAVRLFGGDRSMISKKLRQYGIAVKALKTSVGGKNDERLENGYKYLFYANRKMSMMEFQTFFKEGGVPLREKAKKGEKSEPNREYMQVTPVEQYMIRTGKRLFKGYNNYNDLHRLVFDLETQGLNPRKHRIEQIGIRSNKGFEKILSITGETKEELDKNELKAIDEAMFIISVLKPDTIVGHNSENFDWNFFIIRCDELGTSLAEITAKYFKYPIYKKTTETVLKLGGETEYFYQTIIWGHNVLDSLHAARRAQAIDSSMKSSNLKYLTKYLDLVKKNRVYVKGNIITTTWNDTENKYALCEKDGDWYKITDKRGLLTDYEEVSGRYIVERYLLDDLWETDKVEEKLNESNFLVAKILPTLFTRTCTMGTAGIWKLIMLAWSFEHDLAIPSLGVNRKFTGGLSRLLKTGFVDRIVKLDYNSLYPSIILTWNIDNKVDATNVLNIILNYVLSEREKYKELKAEAGDKADELKASLSQEDLTALEKDAIKDKISYWKAEKAANDKKQLPLKILGNSYFGSAGAEHLYPWGDNIAAEKTTCIGRQMLRLMISHFKSIGYVPIVGDSFTGDTPLFIKYDHSNLIDIKPISELMSNKFKTDGLGREYDTTEKNYSVLCRSGWRKPDYIYRHKTSKNIYRVTDGVSSVDVTEDHSLFNNKKQKISPKEIKSNTKLEYFTDFSVFSENTASISCDGKSVAQLIKDGKLDRVPVTVLNGNKETVRTFLMSMDGFDMTNASKTLTAGLMYLKKKCNND